MLALSPTNCHHTSMSMELGTYSQGEYIPRNVEQRRAVGSTALVFSSPDSDILPSYDTSVIRVIEDTELNPPATIEPTNPEVPSVTNRDYYRLIRLGKRKSGRTSKQRRKFG